MLINIGNFLTNKGHNYFAVHAYTKLLEVDSISSDMVPYSSIINILLTRQKDKTCSNLLSILEKDKYASRFIQQLAGICFQGNKWRQYLNLFVDQMFIRSEDENFL